MAVASLHGKTLSSILEQEKKRGHFSVSQAEDAEFFLPYVPITVIEEIMLAVTVTEV